ncbi:MAG TPA: hypothetical protein VJM76_00640 [Gammaproteobacteria bacterium]|nr:hypothetical protein [Gammaproteobacteria bacterium]
MIELDNPPLTLLGVTIFALIVPIIYSFIVDRFAPNRYKNRKWK